MRILLLGRAILRRTEIALRLALGASRRRIVQQHLVEGLLVAGFGGLVGLTFATWSSSVLGSWDPIPFLPLHFDLQPDFRVVLYALAVTIFTGILVGLFPALQALAKNVALSLRDHAGSTAVGKRPLLVPLLVVAQVAFCMVLLICSGLFLKSLTHAQTTELGFEPGNALAMDLDLDQKGFAEDRGRRFYTALLDRLSVLPGVQSAALAERASPDASMPKMYIAIQGYEPQGKDPGLKISAQLVSSSYLATMKIPLAQGRNFTEQDKPGTPGVVVINETMAQRFWPGKNPIGLHFRIVAAGPGAAPIPAGTDPTVAVVGVARDSKYRTLGEAPTPHFYMAYAQRYSGFATLLVRVNSNPKAMIATVQHELKQMEGGEIEGFFVRTFDEHLGVSLLPARAGAILFSLFGALTLTLAIVGLYSVISRVVIQRTREIGIRMALGASRGNIVHVVLRYGLGLTATGVGVGWMLAWAVTRLTAKLLYGVSPTDPVTFVGVGVMICCVALLACLAPARRATGVDPIRALRS